MGGTREGALKAAAKLKAKNPNYYSDLRKKVKTPANANGFDKDPERARLAGAKGGQKSRRRTPADSDQEAVQSDNGSTTAQNTNEEGAD